MSRNKIRVTYGDLSPEDKIEVLSQAIEAGFIDPDEPDFYDYIDCDITIAYCAAGGFTVEKRLKYLLHQPGCMGQPAGKSKRRFKK